VLTEAEYLDIVRAKTGSLFGFSGKAGAETGGGSAEVAEALGRDLAGLPAAIVSYGQMHQANLPAGGPLDLRVARRLVDGEDGTARMAALVRSFVDTGGAMMTLTVADTDELRAAQQDPQKYDSLRVRMGGWCAYFTMLSRAQQDHHIRRQEGQA